MRGCDEGRRCGHPGGRASAGSQWRPPDHRPVSPSFLARLPAPTSPAGAQGRTDGTGRGHGPGGARSSAPAPRHKLQPRPQPQARVLTRARCARGRARPPGAARGRVCPSAHAGGASSCRCGGGGSLWLPSPSFSLLPHPPGPRFTSLRFHREPGPARGECERRTGAWGLAAPRRPRRPRRPR